MDLQTRRLRLTGWERTWYVTGNILTLGIPYFMKITRKIALIEVWNQEHAARMYDRWAQPPAGQPAPPVPPVQS